MADYQLLIIGGGPGGYTAAIRASQLGLQVGLIEKETELGGTCLRVGCIPSKALLTSSHLYAEAQHSFKDHGIGLGELRLDLKAMMARKDKVVKLGAAGVKSLMKKNKVTVHQGLGRFVAPGVVEVVSSEGVTKLSYERCIIATGSKVFQLPGVEFDGDRIGDSTTALSYPTVPESLIVIGAGVIGLELGSVWARLGSKVTVLEYLDRVLPGMDRDLASEAQKLLGKQGLEFRLGVKVTAARLDGEACVVEMEGQEPLRAERVLCAVGRVPNTDGLGLESIGLPTERGRIIVDSHFATAVPGVYAIGDVIPGPMLAHKSEEEGVACAEYLATGHGHINYDTIPGVVYTHPEVAAVGKTEDELRAAKVPYRKGSFPFRANGRARSMGEVDGFVKVLAHAETDRVLGVHIIGANAGDVIAEAATAMNFHASSEDIARCCHAHPTLSEALKEACLAVDGRGVNM